MTDITIEVGTQSVEKAEKVIKRVFSSIKKSAKDAVSSVEMLQDGVDKFGRNARPVQNLEKAFGALDKGLKELNSGLINATTFQLKYGKAVTDVRKKVRATYGEFEDGVTILQKVDSALKSNIKKQKEHTRALRETEAAAKKLARSRLVNYFNSKKKALNSMNKELERTKRRNQDLVQGFKNLLNPLNLLQGALLGIVAALGVREIISYADAWARVTNSIKVFLPESANVAEVQERLVETAFKTRTALTAQATLYNRLNLVSERLGASQGQIIQVVENVGKAITVTSTSALEARGSLIQLSQALGQDIVRAEEINSILEGTPRIAQAVAATLGLAVSELRQLIKEGVITSEQFFLGLLGASSKLTDEFDKVQFTFGQGFEQLKTGATAFIGRFSKAFKIAETFGRSLDSIGKGLSNLGLVFKTISDEGKDLFKTLTLVGSAILGLSVATAAATKIIQLYKAMQQATAASKALNLALSGSVAGLALIATAAVGLGVYTWYSRNFGDGAKEVAKANEELIKNIELQQQLKQEGKTEEEIELATAPESNTVQTLRKEVNRLTSDLKGATEEADLLRVTLLRGGLTLEEIAETDAFKINQKQIGDLNSEIIRLNLLLQTQIDLDEEARRALQERIELEKERIRALKKASEERKALLKLQKEETQFYRENRVVIEDANQAEEALQFLRSKNLQFTVLGRLEEEKLLSIIAKRDELYKQFTETHTKSTRFQVKNINPYLLILKEILVTEKERIALQKQNEKDAKSLYNESLKKIKALDTALRNLGDLEGDVTAERAQNQAELIALRDEEIETLEILKSIYPELGSVIDSAFDIAIRKSKKIIDSETEIFKAQQKLIKEFEAFVKTVEDELSDVFVGVFDGTIDSFDDFTDRMLKLFNGMLADMAAQAIARPIIVPIVQGFTSTVGNIFGGLFGQAATTGSGAGGGNILGNIASGLVAKSGAGLVSSIGGGKAIIDTSGAVVGTAGGTGSSGAAGALGGLGSAAAVIGITYLLGEGLAGYLRGRQEKGYRFITGLDIGAGVSERGQYRGARGGLPFSPETDFPGKFFTEEMKVQRAIAEYFNTFFEELDETIGGGINEILESIDKTSLRVNLKDFDGDIEEAFADLSGQVTDLVLEPILEQMGLVSTQVIEQAGLTLTTTLSREELSLRNAITEVFTADRFRFEDGVGDIGTAFGKKFIADFAREGETELQAFARFTEIFNQTEDFIDRFIGQIEKFGVRADETDINMLDEAILDTISVDFVNNLILVRDTLSEVNAGLRLLTDTETLTTLDTLTSNWNVLITTLEQANATVDELTIAEEARNIAIGAQISGLTANTLQGIITSGGNVQDAVRTSVTNLLSASLSESLVEQYILPLNEELGAAWIETGGDIEAVTAILKAFDLTPLQDAITDFQGGLSELDDSLTTKDLTDQIINFNQSIEEIIARQTLTDYQFQLRQLDIWYQQQITVANKLGISLERLNLAYSLQRNEIIATERAVGLQSQLQEAQTQRDALQQTRDQAFQDLQDAIKRENDAKVKTLESQISAQRQLQSEAARTADSFSQISESLVQARLNILGQISPVSPTLARAQYQEALQSAFRGDEEALRALPELAQAFINVSRQTTGRPEDFNRIVSQVARELDSANDIAKLQEKKQRDLASIAESQVSQLESQKALLQVSNENFLTVAQAREAYEAADLALKENKWDTIIQLLQDQLAVTKAVQEGGDTQEFFNEAIYLQNKARFDTARIGAGNTDVRDIYEGFGITSNVITSANVLDALTQAGFDPLSHFLQFGIEKGLSPIRLQSFHGGGVAIGPSSGYYAELHGQEAVIPMQGGEIPVQVVGNDNQNIVDAMMMLIRTASLSQRDQKEMLDILTRVTQGNTYIRTQEVA